MRDTIDRDAAALHGTRQPNHIPYRRDIDGLRALAILPVVAFHAGVSGVSGGFVGVDIFFVISGFLITSIIAREIGSGSFSTLAFYKRRIVRILPALTCMLVASSIVAATVLLPRELDDYGRSLIWTALFGSNLFFARSTGYFAGPAEDKPLLHTWSLAVEEQFYILFPLVLVMIVRFMPRRVLPTIVALCGASFLVSLVGLRWEREANFYLLPGRAWELGLGAAIAWGLLPDLANPRHRSLIATGGVALIAAAIAFLSPRSTFPGYNALAPCIGAGLLLRYAPGTWVGRVLSTKAAVWIGLISYPLYLWHWPVIVFGRIAFGELKDAVGIGAILATAGLLAAITTFVVERRVLPLLRRFSPARVVGGGALTIVGLALAGGALTILAPTLHRYPKVVDRLLRYQTYTASADYHSQFRDGTCFLGQSRRDPPRFAAICLAWRADRRNVLLLGDSHAAQYWRGLAMRYPQVNFGQASVASCPPYLDEAGSTCAPVRAVLDDLTGRKPPWTVMLMARWADADLPRLVRTLRVLKRSGYAPIVFGPSPEYGAPLPHLLVRAILRGDMTRVERARTPDTGRLDDRMRVLVEREGGRYVSIYDRACPHDRCRLFAASGVPMLFDTDHFTLAGSRVILDRIDLPF